MKVSVVLAVYNGERFLRETLESVLDQKRLPDELVVVDDASSDESARIAEEILAPCAPSFRVLRHSENRGQAAGFNSGAEVVTGDIVAFLDADDIWFSGKLERVVEAAETCSGFSLIQHQMSVLRGGEITGEVFLPAMASGDLWRMWNEYSTFPNFVPTAGLTVNREVLDKILPFPKELRVSADGYLTRSAICHGPVISIDEPLGAYRLHDSNNVFGNENHDAWAFFVREVKPHLIQYYERIGVKSPLNRCKLRDKSFLGRFKRLSVEQLINFVKSRLNTK